MTPLPILTDAQRAEAVNGCGRKGGWIRPPQWLFRSSCNDHDIRYYVGGTERDRREADEIFRADMLRAANAGPTWARPWMHVHGWIYYRAVRLCGRWSYHYRKPTEP